MTLINQPLNLNHEAFWLREIRFEHNTIDFAQSIIYCVNSHRNRDSLLLHDNLEIIRGETLSFNSDNSLWV